MKEYDFLSFSLSMFISLFLFYAYYSLFKCISSHKEAIMSAGGKMPVMTPKYATGKPTNYMFAKLLTREFVHVWINKINIH